MPHREEAPGKTQDMLERLCLSADLGTPRGPSGRAGGSVWGEGVQTSRSTVHITRDLSWSSHVNTLVKKARQRLYHLRRLKDFNLPSKVLKTFYTCSIESILTGSITAWFGNSTKQDRQALQRVVRSAKLTICTELPDLETIYGKRCWIKARKIMKDLSHPNNRLFSLL
ncbi:hypothetical protein QTP86_018134, partial [Hemibagrus guttatus]